MASTGKTILIQKENITGNTTSSKISLGQGTTAFILLAKVENRVAGTFTVTFEHSADGITWKTLAALPAISSDTSEIDTTVDKIMTNVRASVVTGGVPNADVTAEILYDKR